MRCSWKYKLFILAIFSLAYGVFYLYPNFHPKWEPLLLPLLSIDYLIPFLPWTFLIYISDYVLFLVLIIILKDAASFNALCRMAFAVLVIAGMFFIFFPTTYPRPVYPESSSLLLNLVLRAISSADTPNNCFPSLHVALTGIGAWSVRSQGTGKSLRFWVWATAIFLSTLTTKQHYFVDVLGGLLVVVSVVTAEWALFEKKYLRAYVERWIL